MAQVALHKPDFDSTIITSLVAVLTSTIWVLIWYHFLASRQKFNKKVRYFQREPVLLDIVTPATEYYRDDDPFARRTRPDVIGDSSSGAAVRGTSASASGLPLLPLDHTV